jgi:integrase
VVPARVLFVRDPGADHLGSDPRCEFSPLLGEAGDVPLPDGLTPHELRHTFASILVALGVDPGSVMDQLGHTDPGFTLRVYRHGMRRDGPARERLRALVGGAQWIATDSS